MQPHFQHKSETCTTSTRLFAPEKQRMAPTQARQSRCSSLGATNSCVNWGGGIFISAMIGMGRRRNFPNSPVTPFVFETNKKRQGPAKGIKNHRICSDYTLCKTFFCQRASLFQKLQMSAALAQARLKQTCLWRAWAKKKKKNHSHQLHGF